MTCLTLWERIGRSSLIWLKKVKLSKDVLQGTQLLAIVVVVAVGLLRRALIGDELIDKEKQALRRTMTDLATVVPISFLMLLPISSTYGTERLDLLRQLEKVKQLESTDVNPTEIADI